MKKSLFILLALFLSIDLMAQTTLTIDVSNQPNKHVDVSGYTSLTRLNVIGATGVTLPAGRTTFTLDGTGSPDLVVDFAEQASRTTLTTLTLINVNQVDISSCSALVTLNCQGKGTEWGDGTDGHKGLICNTGATDDSWTLPALTSIRAQGSGVQKLDMTNAATNLANLNICKSSMKELYIPNHLGFIAAPKTSSSNTGLSLGYSSVDTLNYNTGTNSSGWKGVGEFQWNQLEVLDISGCSELPGTVTLSAGSANYNESPLRKFNANGCVKIEKIQIYNASLDAIDAIDVRNCSKLTTFFVEQSRLKTVNFSGCDTLVSINAKRNNFTDGNFLTMPYEDRTAAHIARLRNIQLNGGASASIMKDINGNEQVVIRDVFTNKISNFDTRHLSGNMEKLLISDNLLQTLNIHTGMSGLKTLECENNMLLTLDLSKLNPNIMEKAVWGSDMTKEKLQVGFLNVEEIKGMSQFEDGSKDWVGLPLPNGGGYAHLLDNSVKLFPTIADAMSGDDSRAIAEENNAYMGTIEDFNEKEGQEILCPTGHTGELLFLHSQDEIKQDNDGKIVDQDLYDKILVYKYNTQFNNGEPKVIGGTTVDPHIQIRAHIWPYILNINPVGKESGENNPTGIDYYVSTLCLDYDAIIPNGVTLHVPVGVQEGYKPQGQPESTYVLQFDMKDVGTTGMVLPKNTPVVVKSETAAGLYAFQPAWEVDVKGWEDYRTPAIKEAVAKQRGCDPDSLYAILHMGDSTKWKSGFDPELNPEKWVNNDPEIADYLERSILSGTQEEMQVAKKSILALGRQKATGSDGKASLRVGFWRLNATSLPAHRCYILPEKLQSAMDEANITGAKDGGVFYFGENEATAIRTIDTDAQPQQKEDVVYDLQGRRITGKPVPGIYIINGKKVVVK